MAEAAGVEQPLRTEARAQGPPVQEAEAGEGAEEEARRVGQSESYEDHIDVDVNSPQPPPAQAPSPALPLALAQAHDAPPLQQRHLPQHPQLPPHRPPPPHPTFSLASREDWL